MLPRLAHTHFTLWTYIVLWLFGAFFSFLQVWAFWGRTQDHHALFPTIVLGLAFIAINLHQLHVYRSIHELDDGLDNTPYSSKRFIGTRVEIALRILIFICLLAAGGKLNDTINEMAPTNEWNPIVFYTSTLVVLFALLVIWDATGLVKDRDQLRPRVDIWTVSVRQILNSNKYSRLWFLVSDGFGLGISISILVMVDSSGTEMTNWSALFVIPYLAIIALRFVPKGIVQEPGVDGPDGNAAVKSADLPQPDAQAQS